MPNEYLTSQTSQQITKADERREIQIRLDQLEKQETRIVRDLADQDKLDLVDRTIEAITNEKATLQERVDALDARLQVLDISEDQLRGLAAQAQGRMHSPSPN